MLAHLKPHLLLGLAVTCVLVGFVFTEEDEIEGEDPVPHSVRVESCAG